MRDQEIIGLWEAYQQVHSQPEEVEQLMEGVRPGNVETPINMKKYRERRRSLAGREANADARSRGHVDRLTGKTYSTDEARSRRRNIHTPAAAPSRAAARDAAGGETGRGGRLRKNKEAKARAVGELGEQNDIYDIILSHLLDEGYAETPEAAEVIMVNMSEEWRESIVEDIAARAAKVVDDQRQGYLGDADAIRKNQDALSKSMGRLKKGQGPVVTPGLPGV